jgi:NADH dehydrogenase FAD-containing subunit
VLGSRVNIPADDFQHDNVSGEAITVSLQNGTTLQADVVIPATGQSPNTQFLSPLRGSSEDSLINPNNGFIRVKPTLQFQDPLYPRLFAVGDIADSGAHKAARPGAAQAQVVAKNVLALIEGREPAEKIEVTPPGIHLTLGLVSAAPVRPFPMP